MKVATNFIFSSWKLFYLGTHLPILDSKKFKLSFLSDLNVSDIFVHVSGSDLLRIACKSPCGATSMQIAFLGIYLQASSNNTGFSKLFVKYSAEHRSAMGKCHSDSGTEELTHLEERCFGSGIICIQFKTKQTVAIFVII